MADFSDTSFAAVYSYFPINAASAISSKAANTFPLSSQSEVFAYTKTLTSHVAAPLKATKPEVNVISKSSLILKFSNKLIDVVLNEHIAVLTEYSNFDLFLEINTAIYGLVTYKLQKEASYEPQKIYHINYCSYR
jgi:hypothetical protein